ncbi:RsmE family RNA methyltransferase [Furfurilactobacillus curtus]
MMQRYFLPVDFGRDKKFALDDATYHHFVQVLRAQIGQAAEFVTPTQQLFLAQLSSLDLEHHRAIMTIERQLEQTVELPIHVRLVCGLPKGDKADFITQKATELGASEIVFVKTTWSIADWRNKVAKKRQRLQTIALNAAQQAHRLMVPEVHYLDQLSQIDELPTDIGLVAWEESAKAGEQTHLAQVLTTIAEEQTLTVVFGPEGGLTPDEVTALQAVNYHPVGLGPRILRTETAPLYLLSAVSFATEMMAH